MLTREHIAQLDAFDSRGAGVLSVYLNLDPARQARRSSRIVFEDLVKEAREPLDKKLRNELASEAARIGELLESRQAHGRGLAVFSCGPRKLWDAHFLPVPIRDHLVFGPKPDIAPLLEVLDDYERYAVALINKEQARLYTVFLGEIEETAAFEDDVPGKHEHGGASQSHFQRHHELHVYWHLKRVAQRLTELFGRRPFDRLILAGPEEATSELRRVLPRALAHRVVGVIALEMSAGSREILERTLEIERRVEREVEERLLKDLLEAAGAGGRAVVGLEATLEALRRGQVQTLVVAEGTQLDGSECPNCGKLSPGTIATCPACDAPMRPAHDLVHRAMARAIEQAGSVEVVHGDAARRLLEGGVMGAWLRYR